MKFRYHYLLFIVFIYACTVVFDGWDKSESQFWLSFIYFNCYLAVYANELVQYIIKKER